MNADKKYCMSSFLTFRTIIDDDKCFIEGIVPQKAKIKADKDRIPVRNEVELYDALKSQVENMTAGGKTALALSGGIDSAIMAKFMPKGSTAYTFKCIVPGVSVTDETVMAAKYAEECGLKHKVVEIYWEDFEKYAPILMLHKGAPMHSIEVQIYKAALQAKEDGFDGFLFGESSDVLYGGMSQLLSKDWTVGEFIDRYTYVNPYYALKDPELVLEPYYAWEKDGYIDVHGFNSHVFYQEGLGSYVNACGTAGITFHGPFSNTFLDTELDLTRVRRGENKYLVRNIFHELYPDFEIPQKTPMPRPVNEWFKNWTGPSREEFWPHCTDCMNGDQRWLIWALENFLNIIEQ